MAMWGRMLGLGRSENYNRAIRFFDQGLYEQAIELFRATLSERGEALSQRLARFYLAEAHTALALGCLDRSAWERAEAELQQAILIHPTYADLHYHLGVARLGNNDTAGALDALRRSLEINPQYAKALLQLGIALYASGDRAGGLRHAGEALARDEAFDKALLSQAREADARDDVEQALQFLKRIAEADVDDIAFHTKLAVDLYRRGMFMDAADEFRQALVINPNYADLRNQLGITLFAAGRDLEAESEFKQALAINGCYVEAYVNLGLVLERLERPDQAQQAFRSALALDPDNTLAREHLADSS